MNKKIAIVGCGYVGYALASALKEHNEVVCIDKDQKVVKKMIKKGLTAMEPKDGIYNECEIAFIALPTNYNGRIHGFNTEAIDKTAAQIAGENKECKIVIKSTVPIGYTDTLRKRLCSDNIFFSPEFLSEGHEMEDMEHPYRIIIGCGESEKENGKEIAELLSEICTEKPRCILISPEEAESVKLFSNTYLAMRVAFFNEVDTFAKSHDLNAGNLIDGICADGRIGENYNNPSFGYGGYCLPKDTKQLKENMKNDDTVISKAVVEANKRRKEFIVKDISKKVKKNGIVGFYRLSMKAGSNDCRNSASVDIMKMLRKARPDIDICIYEPSTRKKTIKCGSVIKDIDEFCSLADLIIANRVDENLLQKE